MARTGEPAERLRELLPPALRPWGDAILHEVTAIADDRDALAFALAGLRGLAARGGFGVVERADQLQPGPGGRTAVGLPDVVQLAAAMRPARDLDQRRRPPRRRKAGIGARSACFRPSLGGDAPP